MGPQLSTYWEATIFTDGPDRSSGCLASIVREQTKDTIAVWELLTTGDSDSPGLSTVYADAVAVVTWVPLACMCQDDWQCFTYVELNRPVVS